MFKDVEGRVVLVLSWNRCMRIQLQGVEYFLNIDYLAVGVEIGGAWSKHKA